MSDREGEDANVREMYWFLVIPVAVVLLLCALGGVIAVVVQLAAGR
jgi:hypothetical protein